MTMLQKTGGARLGITNGTIPFGQLAVTSDFISVGIRMVQDYTFSQDEVVSIEPVIWFPIVAWGVRVRHSREDAPATIIFWTIAPPGGLIKEIEEVGFIARAPKDAEVEHRFPFRVGFLVMFFVLWNAGFLGAVFVSQVHHLDERVAILPVITLAAIAAALVLFVPSAQKVALKDGVNPDRVAPILRLILLVLTLMITAMTLALV